MAKLRSRYYKHVDYTALLAELHGAAGPTMPAEPQKPALQKPVEVSPAARRRASLLSDPKMRYGYSAVNNILHDRDCELLKEVRDEDFCMLADFNTALPVCPHCCRKAIIRSGIGADAKRINAYLRIFDRMQAKTAELRELILENGARLSQIDLDRVVIHLREDRWMICFVNGRAQLYHNNYDVLENYQRLIGEKYHLQSDGRAHAFRYYLNMMIQYSWEEHVVYLKARALARLQDKLRARLASVANWLQLPGFSLFHFHCRVMDCGEHLEQCMREYNVACRELWKEEENGTPYRLADCRIRKWERKKFCAAMAALKEYSVLFGWYDYADVCERKLGVYCPQLPDRSRAEKSCAPWRKPAYFSARFI